MRPSAALASLSILRRSISTLAISRFVELGWHTRRTFWNRGIATEAATAARDLAFRCFGLSRLVAVIHPDHIASRRVAENIGMHDEKTTVIDDDYPAVIYATKRR